MPEPSLQQLIQQYQSQAQVSQTHAAFLQAILNYETQTANFRQTRRRKKLPLVRAQDKAHLMELHKAIGNTAEEILKDKAETKALKDIVKKIAVLSAGSYQALLQYDPAKEQKTLASLEDDVRTLTIHQGSVLLGGEETLGGAQSERVPLSFLDAKGNRISGVFSRKKTIEPKKQLTEAFQKMTGRPFFSMKPDSGDIRWLQDHFMEIIRQVPAFANKLGPDASDEDYLTAMMQECVVTDKQTQKNSMDPDRLQACVEMGLREAKQQIPAISEDSWNELARNFEPMISTLLFAHHTGKIPFGGRLDNRNAAMSAVADLLGMPNVVARSKPMRIIDKNGNVIEGTFMEAAKGMDPENLPPEAANIPRDALKGTDGKAFKDIANLQVLDYLCGNYDRHFANMFYQFDKNGKLIGVQGIDNDGAFGLIAKKELGHTGQNYLHMTNLSNMKAMPKQTAERIMALDAGTLKYALRGFGLSEEELTAAEHRLGFLKQAITRSREKTSKGEKPSLRIMSDNDFKKTSIDDLRKDALGGFDFKQTNTFSTVDEAVYNLPNMAAEQTKAYRDLKNATAVGMDNRAEPAVAGKERVKGAALQTLLSKRTWWGFSSGNYEELQRAAKGYFSTYQAIESRLAEANKEENKRLASYHHELDAVVKEEDLLRMQAASQRLRDAAMTYLSGKMPDFREKDLDEPVQYPEGASDYTKRRIDAAMDALRLGRQGVEIKPVERQTAQNNLREAQAAQQRRMEEREPQLLQPVQGSGPVQTL